MTRILTGIQSSGTPHLGNVLGAMLPAIELSKKNESLLFIADLHALTTIKNKEQLLKNSLETAAAWIACGLDTKKNILYRQSDIPQVTELMWYLNCITPYPMLANAHSFKDKSEKLSDVNAGLFTYPVLMAADIILYNANIVPVGKDQIQHLEITRDIANKFNNIYGETFTVPEAKLKKESMIIPGTDGQKMSKSYGNTIDVFEDEKRLKKQIMSIKTDSKGLEEPKNPDECNVFQIYKLIGSKVQVEDLKLKYLKGGYGYGHAKKELFNLILENFKEPRNNYKRLINEPDVVNHELTNGAKKASEIAKNVLRKVKSNLGLM
ncbi:MAG: tryptophan--tRNA ligase [Flavobacteriales bacterium TMED191]|nr:MAG: tryptophan--tRNA ligase [Flavobacteriales bacterium TMED191]